MLILLTWVSVLHYTYVYAAFAILVILSNNQAYTVYVLTQIVLVFKTLDISQGSVATHLRCGGIFSDSIITNVLIDSDSEIDLKIR